MPERKPTRTADLDYFYGQSSELFSFYRIPKLLFQDSRFQPLSTDAKTLYGILLDRMSLSARNGWLDKAGRVFIIYTVQEVQDSLGCADKKATKLLREWFATAPAIRAGVVAGEPLRQKKNLFIVTVTLASRAAIQGGMQADDAFTLSYSYIRLFGSASCYPFRNGSQTCNTGCCWITQSVWNGCAEGKHPQSWLWM